MPSLTIRDIPDDLLANLRRVAKANRRSLSNEILIRLERSAGLKPIYPQEAIARTHRLHQRVQFRTIEEGSGSS
jgi:plasmid stability protein